MVDLTRKTSTETEHDRSAWNISTRNRGAQLYALSIVRRDFTNVRIDGGTSTANGRLSRLTNTRKAGERNPDEFVFVMNPQAIDMEEPAAVSIVPTQDGGQFIEHQGQIYKNININGTTGVRPSHKGGANIIPIIGIPNPFANPNINPVTGLPRNEATGMDDLIALRNLFRRYFDLKEDPVEGHQYIMVWQNGKEGEYYQIEPIVFKTKRASSAPVSFNYEIQLRTIQKLDQVAAIKIVDSRLKRMGSASLSERITEAMRDMAFALRQLNAAADNLVGKGQRVVNDVLTPLRTLLNSTRTLVATSARAIAIPRNSVALLANDSLELMEALQNPTDQINAYKQFGIMTGAAFGFEAAKTSFRAANRLFIEDFLFNENLAGNRVRKQRAYVSPNRSGRPPRTGGSPTDLNNVVSHSGSAIATVHTFDNIFSVTQRLLGDQARWKEIVLLNNLKSPYVDPSGDGKNVLRPGDDILFPSGGGGDGVNIVPDQSQETDKLANRLGRDIRLVEPDAVGGDISSDLAVSSQGDLALIEGVPNLEQAINIKFSTEQGTLPTHPGFGIQVPIGSKFRLRTMVGFQLNARGSLTADSRISQVNRLVFSTRGNTTSVTADVAIADVDDSISLSVDARR